MKLKKGMAMALCLMMAAGSLAACGNQGSGNHESNNQESSDKENVNMQSGNTAKTQEVQDHQSGKETSGAVSAGNYNVTWEDMADVNMMYLATSTIPAGLPDVEAAINEITEPELNIHVNLEMVETGSYAQQVSLRMASSEAVDLLLTMPADSASFTSMQAQNQLMDLTDLLEEYGQDIQSILGDKLKGTSANGRVYGVPGNRTYVVSTWVIMRTDVLEDLGLLEKAQNMSSLDEYEEILEAVISSEKWGTLAGMVSSDGQGTCLGINPGYLATESFETAGCYDSLGDNNFLVSISPDGSSQTIRNSYMTEEFRAIYEKMHDWYEKGYVYKDTATNAEMAESLIKSGVAFSYIGNCEEGVETLKSTACGMPMTCVKVKTYPITTSSLTKFVWTIPNSAKEPEAAMTFLDMMFTDSRIANLLAWGIEGRDYEVVDGEACYVDGTEGAYHSDDFLFGNQFITLPWQGDGADFREKCEAVEAAGTVSEYLGFTADTSSVTNEIGAVTNVIAEYKGQVHTGSCEPEVFDDFLKKLEDNGAQKIIDCYQTQLDEWLRAQ